MEACLLITTTNKSKDRKGNILIVNAVKEVKQEKNIAFLEQHHIKKIYQSYLDFKDEDGFSRVVDIDTVLNNKASLNIAQYVSNVVQNNDKKGLMEEINEWQNSSAVLQKSMHELFDILK